MLGKGFLGISEGRQVFHHTFNSALQYRWIGESPFGLGLLWVGSVEAAWGLHPKDLNTAGAWHHCSNQGKLPQEQLLSTHQSLKFPPEPADTFLLFLLSHTGTGDGQKAAMKSGGGVERFNIHPSRDKTSLSQQTSLAGAGPSHHWWEKVENSTFKELRMFLRQIPLYLHWEGCVTYLQ